MEVIINKRSVGEKYEQIAARYLTELGYKILEYNYRCRFGEIDIVASDNCDLVFVEVKYRNSERFGTPFEAVDTVKQQKIIKTACSYMLEHGISNNIYVRYDVVGITNNEIKLVKNAFGSF